MEYREGGAGGNGAQACGEENQLMRSVAPGRIADEPEGDQWAGNLKICSTYRREKARAC